MTITSMPNLQVLNLAESFHDAADLLSRANANAIPIINLRCHAIELFLKSLHLKDSETELEGGVILLTPVSGRGLKHALVDSFNHAHEIHRERLTSGRASLCDDLRELEGVFMKSRYIYESGESLPLRTAEAVSEYLAKVLRELPRVAVRDENTD